MIRTYTVQYNRATNHINGLDELTKGSELNYSLSACSSVTRGHLAAGQSFETVADALANASVAGGRRLCKNCEKAAKAALARDEAAAATERLRQEVMAQESREAVEAAAQETPADEPTEAPIYTITVRYRINRPPFQGHMFLVPMITPNKLLGDVRRELRESLNLAPDELSVIQINILEAPVDGSPLEIPTDYPTITLAPGIYYRPLVMNTGTPCNYTLHWARLIDRGLVYSIRRDVTPGASREVVLADATPAEVREFLAEVGMEIAPGLS